MRYAAVLFIALGMAGCSRTDDARTREQAQQTREDARKTADQLRQDSRQALHDAKTDAEKASRELNTDLNKARDKVRQAVNAPPRDSSRDTPPGDNK